MDIMANLGQGGAAKKAAGILLKGSLTNVSYPGIEMIQNNQQLLDALEGTTLPNGKPVDPNHKRQALIMADLVNSQRFSKNSSSLATFKQGLASVADSLKDVMNTPSLINAEEIPGLYNSTAGASHTPAGLQNTLCSQIELAWHADYRAVVGSNIVSQTFDSHPTANLPDRYQTKQVWDTFVYPYVKTLLTRALERSSNGGPSFVFVIEAEFSSSIRNNDGAHNDMRVVQVFSNKLKSSRVHDPLISIPPYTYFNTPNLGSTLQAKDYWNWISFLLGGSQTLFGSSGVPASLKATIRPEYAAGLI